MATDCKVLDLSAFRRRRTRQSTALYIHDQAEWLDEILRFPEIHVASAQCLESLANQICEANPEIILLESSIDWADPIDLIRQLDERCDAPIVLLCNTSPRTSRRMIKNAYTAGISDVLYAGQADELDETLDVLLKFQRRLTTSV